ncbi:MAG: type I-E CRISPR-associated protein Cse1/CasA, partial [Elusimicrobiota bacterium]
INGNDNCLKVAFMPGVGYNYKDSQLRDPMCPYSLNEKRGIEQIGWEDRGFWRSFPSLLPETGGNNVAAPSVISYIASLSLAGLIQCSIPLSVSGQKFKNAAIEFWRMERFTFPLNISAKYSSKSEIFEMLQLAEKTGDRLEKGIRNTGKFILTKTDSTKTIRELKPDKWKYGKLEPGDLTKYLVSTGVVTHYWSILESRFHEILGDFAAGTDADIIRCRWLTYVRGALKTVWEQYAASIDSGDAWAIRALVKAERPVLEKLKELSVEIEKYQKQEVG